jgi:REP element-mobilizing transposase RayT
VFSTKERRKLIPLDHRTKLWAYMAGVCSKEKILPHEIGGIDDHAHLLIQLPPTWSLSDAVEEIKTSSSRWMGRSFNWQRGFAAFSVSASNNNAVVRYIRTQDAHHKTMDYKSELIALLEKHGVPYDPKYVSALRVLRSFLCVLCVEVLTLIFWLLLLAFLCASVVGVSFGCTPPQSAFICAICG